MNYLLRSIQIPKYRVKMKILILEISNLFSRAYKAQSKLSKKDNYLSKNQITCTNTRSNKQKDLIRI